MNFPLCTFVCIPCQQVARDDNDDVDLANRGH